MEFRKTLLSVGLSGQQSILGLHRLGVAGLLSEEEEVEEEQATGKLKKGLARFGKVRVYQALIDLKTDQATSDSQYSKQVFRQSCNLGELAFSSTDRESFNHVERWKQTVEDEIGPVPMILVQTKTDLAETAAAMTHNETD